MLEVFILSLVIVCFFIFSLAIKVIIKGETDIKGVCCSKDEKNSSSECSRCDHNIGNACSTK